MLEPLHLSTLCPGAQGKLMAWKVQAGRYQQDCFGRARLEPVPVARLDYLSKQQPAPARAQKLALAVTRSQDSSQGDSPPRRVAGSPSCRGRLRVKNRCQVSVRKCGGREKRAVYHCQCFPRRRRNESDRRRAQFCTCPVSLATAVMLPA